MKCSEFETVVNDLARNRMLDASLREKALAHIKHCAPCDARLAEEKQLTVGLRALATLHENKKASAQVEANLLAVFRKQADLSHAQTANLAAISSSSSVSKFQLRRWAVAAAAVILVLLALVVLRLQTATQDHQIPLQQAGQPTPQQQTPHKDENGKPVAPDDVNPSVIGKDEKSRKPLRNSVKDVQKLLPHFAAAKLNHSQSNAKAQTAQNTDTQTAQPEEITTSFISLTQGYSLPMSEGGQVVRVELPRSALASFGLPISAERINERVKADVVVGNDGIARAIRFVR
jgi:hypothetical protein